MKITFEKYTDYINNIPNHGKHIVAYSEGEAVVVYQAYRNAIADYAFKHQCLGGPHYSFNRMSWIKPNFLWMMYRCGWAVKEGQENVLAIWITKDFFEKILSEAVYSSYQQEVYGDQEAWKKDLKLKEVRLQWDPDHDPFGKSQERRAIQLGLKGDILKEFGQSQILKIEDMSAFIQTQRALVQTHSLEELHVPKERVYVPQHISLQNYLGVN
ncbi:MAG: DUF4291 domain-containing protein [Azospira oryzae]|jgi:hypothetical protein|nr:DUF4291 domain-containing protein [Cytophaga sp.]PZR37935.1 MAG: DUF4291 domain-containing protein [Azospira oryzae]